MPDNTNTVFTEIIKGIPYFGGFIASLLVYIWYSTLKELKDLIEAERRERKEDLQQHEKYYEKFFDDIKYELIDNKKSIDLLNDRYDSSNEKWEKKYDEIIRMINLLNIKCEKNESDLKNFIKYNNKDDVNS